MQHLAVQSCMQLWLTRLCVQVANTPDGHVTRDFQEGCATLADLRFKVIDTSGA